MFHLLPVAALEVSLTDPPEQKESGPLLLITGVEGKLLTDTTAGIDVDDIQEPTICRTL